MKVTWRILVWFVLIVLYFISVILLMMFIPIYSGPWWIRLGWAGFILLLAALIGACADPAALSPCQPDWYRIIDQHDLFRADIVFVNCHWRLK